MKRFFELFLYLFVVITEVSSIDLSVNKRVQMLLRFQKIYESRAWFYDGRGRFIVLNILSRELFWYKENLRRGVLYSIIIEKEDKGLILKSAKPYFLQNL